MLALGEIVGTEAFRGFAKLDQLPGYPLRGNHQCVCDLYEI